MSHCSFLCLFFSVFFSSLFSVFLSRTFIDWSALLSSVLFF
ncbi:hypothetical protein CSUI_006535, partial [Cystoisospora suis]